MGGEQFNIGPQKKLEEVFLLTYPGLKHRACFEETSGRLRQRADRPHLGHKPLLGAVVQCFGAPRITLDWSLPV